MLSIRRILLGTIVALLALTGQAVAATISVTTSFDDQQQGDGQCSLRKAILDVDSPGSGQTDCAPAAFGANTIVLPPGPHYQLGGSFPPGAGSLVIAPNVKNLTIAGGGSSDTIIDAGPLNNRAFQISAGAIVTLLNVAVVNASALAGSAGAAGAAGDAGANGGAILNQGTLTLTGVAITNSKAGAGGAGGAAASGPGGDGGAGGSGGAVYNTGTLTLSGTTIGSDSAGSGGAGGAGLQANPGTPGGNGGDGGTGGGIENAGGALTITASTIRGNTAGSGGVGGTGGSGNSSAGGAGGAGGEGADGGGVWSDGGSLSITNATFASNSAGAGGTGGSGGAGTTDGANGAGGDGGDGGGVGASSPSSATLLQVTEAGNSAGSGGTGGSGTGGSAGANGSGGSGGGVNAEGSSITLRNSLLALNNGGNCLGSVLDGGFNLSFGDSTCPTAFSGGDPNLGPLQDNGGSAPTISLQPGSAAINQVPAAGANCPATDERGVPRPQGSSSSKCDIGAYEVAGPLAVTLAATNVSLTGATLNGQVTPNAGTSSVTFQYGTSTKYGKTTPLQHIGGVTGAPLATKLSGLKPNTTYHYRVVIVAMDGTALGADRTFTTSVTPAISNAKITPKSFAAKRGATISYRDSMVATTTLVAFRCVKFRRGKCTQYARLGSMTHRDVAGTNRIKVKGRLGSRKLQPGSYRLQLTPRAAGKAGRTVTTTFRVL